MDKQPHNNLWAEKLLQVSMPDSGEAWAGMEAILDRRLPQRFRGDRRRWLLLILLLLLLIGVCNCPGRGRLFHRSGQDTRTSGTHTANPGRTRPRVGATPRVLPATPATPAAPATPALPAIPAAPGTPAVPGFEPTILATRRIRSGPLPPASVTAEKRNPPALAVTPSGRPTPAAHRGTSRPSPGKTTSHPVPLATTHRSHKHKVTASHHRHRPAATPAAFGDITQTTSGGSSVAGNPARPRPPAKRTGAPTAPNNTPRSSSPGNDPSTGKNAPAPPKPGPWKDDLRKDSLGKDSLRNDSSRRDSMRRDSSHKKPPPPPPPPPQMQDQKEKDHGWVFGIGVNQFFPLGDQRGSTYNSNGLTGTLTDYLPVPMIRYYLSHKAYLQAEAQFNTPQPTAKNLVISEPLTDSTFSGGVLTQVATQASIQQLYYFNIPLSIHFNPWDNLDIGTGLQWSHLSNAIGEFDTSTSTTVNGNIPSVVDAKSTHSFKGDALYQRISSNEFRFLFDVNYTYKHWVLGLRYNQALSKFVNLQLPATGATTQARNSSLQVYLRYILWDTRKKKPVPKTP